MDNSIDHPLWMSAQIEPFSDTSWLPTWVTTEEEFEQMNPERRKYSATNEELYMWILFNALLFTNYSGQDSGE